MTKDRSSAQFAGLLAALLLGACVWMPTAWHIGWLSDDRQTVYGNPLRPIPTLAEAFQDGGFGVPQPHPSVVRIFALAFSGSVGHLLGPGGSHVLQGLMHLLCGLMFCLVLRGLRWSATTAGWTTALFLVSPWITMPIFWWSGNLVIPSTIFMLSAALMYIRWSDSARKSQLHLALAMVFVLLSLCWYEIWLAAFGLFWAIEVYLQCVRPEPKPLTLKTFVQALKVSLPMITPFLIWGIAAKLTYVASVRQPHLPLRRIPIELLAVQLRVYNWFTTIHWRWAVVAGAKAVLTTPEGLISLVLTAGALLWVCQCASMKKDKDDAIPLLPGLVLAWAWFMAGRLVLILLGGISLHTRHNYGGAMGLAVGAIVICDNLGRRLPQGVRRLVLMLGGVFILILTFASAGAGVHYRQTTYYERITLDQIQSSVGNLPAGTTVVLLGDPTHAPGELGFFSELDSDWFGKEMRRVRPDLNYFAASSAQPQGNIVHFVAMDKVATHTLDVPDEALAICDWSDGRLITVPRGQPIPPPDQP